MNFGGSFPEREYGWGDSSATMSYYSSLVYLMATFVLTPLVIAIGDFPDAHPSIGFLFQPWAMPSLLDWAVMSGLGLVWAGAHCLYEGRTPFPLSDVHPSLGQLEPA